jgi:hypothetical protein
MPRPAVLAATAVSLVVAGFVAGAATAAMRGWGDRDVQVDIVNESGQRVTAVALYLDTCGARSVLARGALEAGERTSFRFGLCGEGGYQLQARLANGVEVQGGGDYVEGGARETGHVRAKGIVTDVASSGD